MDFAGQTVGVVAMFLMIFSYQCKSSRKLYIMQGAGGLLFAVSFFMLGSSLSGLVNLSNLVRAYFASKKECRTTKYFLISSALYLIPLAINWSSWWSYVLVAVQLIGTYTLIKCSGNTLRKVQLAILSPAWLINNIFFSFSLGGILCEAFVVMSVIASFIRYKKSGFID